MLWLSVCFAVQQLQLAPTPSNHPVIPSRRGSKNQYFTSRREKKTLDGKKAIKLGWIELECVFRWCKTQSVHCHICHAPSPGLFLSLSTWNVLPSFFFVFSSAWVRYVNDRVSQIQTTWLFMLMHTKNCNLLETLHFARQTSFPFQFWHANELAHEPPILKW